MNDDLEEGLKEPRFENIVIPEHFGPVKEQLMITKSSGMHLNWMIIFPGRWKGENPFGTCRIAQAGL